MLILSFFDSKGSFWESFLLSNVYNTLSFFKERTALLAVLFLFILIFINESHYRNTIKPFSIMRRRTDLNDAPWENSSYYFLDLSNKKERLFSNFANQFFHQIIIFHNLFSQIPHFSGIQQQQRLLIFLVLKLAEIFQLQPFKQRNS